jgi:peptidyl-tRNA hydrolase, PTH1 family
MAFRSADRRGTPSDFLVIGLGNPGKEYARSRHNVGAEVVERLAAAAGSALKPGKEKALVADIRLADKRVALAFPITFMNLSGESAQLLVKR